MLDTDRIGVPDSCIEKVQLPNRKSDFLFRREVLDKVDFEALRPHLNLLKKEAGKDYSENEIFGTVARLGYELKDRLANYQTILSDDASGRVVSLYLRELTDSKRIKAGRDPVKTYFLALGYINSDREKAVKKFIADRKESLGKTLLVTEFIATGQSINKLVDTLEDQGIDFDVAALSVSSQFFNDTDNQKLMKGLVSRLRYGSESNVGLMFYGSRFNGVQKGVDVEPGFEAHPQRYSLYQDGVARVRKDIKAIAKEVSRVI